MQLQESNRSKIQCLNRIGDLQIGALNRDFIAGGEEFNLGTEMKDSCPQRVHCFGAVNTSAIM